MKQRTKQSPNRNETGNKEQTKKQRNNLQNTDGDRNQAHYGEGFSAENNISGNLRIVGGGTPASIVGQTPNGTPLLTGTDSRKYYQTSTGQTKTLDVIVRNNNVVKVKTKN